MGAAREAEVAGAGQAGVLGGDEEQHETEDWLEAICRVRADKVATISSLNVSIFFSIA